MTDDNNGIIRIEGEDKYAHRNFPTTIDSEESIEKLIDRFLMDTQNIVEVTKKRYKKSLKIYFRWINKMGFALRDITLSELLMYRKDLESRTTKNRSNGEAKKLSTYTVSAYLVAVKEFYGWASGIGLMMNPALNLVPPKREHKYKRMPLNEKQMDELLAYFKKSSIRDFAIASVMYYCGLRTIEVSRLDIGDIEIVDDVRKVWIHGKGRTSKDEWVKINDKAFIPIRDYLLSRDDDSKKLDPIFISEGISANGNRLVPDTISRIIKSGLKAIGLDDAKYTAHGVRHSSATNAIRKGASLEQVQAMLRHKNSSTSKIYGEMAMDERRLKEKGAEDFL